MQIRPRFSLAVDEAGGEVVGPAASVKHAFALLETGLRKRDVTEVTNPKQIYAAALAIHRAR